MEEQNESFDEEGAVMNILKMLVRNDTTNPAAPATQTQEVDGVSELLVYYMKQFNEIQTENDGLKERLEKTQAEAEGMLVANAAMKASLASSRKKMAAMERKLTRLTAIEKVWKETFSKLQLSVQQPPVPVLAMGDGGKGLEIPDDEYLADHEDLLAGVVDIEDED